MKKALIIRFANSVRPAHSGRTANVHSSRQPPSLPQLPPTDRINGASLLAAAKDRENLEDTWEEWNADIEKLITGLETRNIPYVRVLLDLKEIEEFCEEQGIPNDAKARSNLAIHKAEQNAR